MIAAMQILQTDAVPAAVIRLTVPRTEMIKVFPAAVGEVMTVVAAQGLKPLGAVFAHHLKLSAEVFDFEVGVTLDAPVAAAGRVRPGELPAARVARCLYSGQYQGLASAWDEFHTWMTANALEPAGDLWEVYLVGPASTQDPAQWRTELNRPLKK